MFKPKITLSKSLYEKLKSAADAQGCASVEEFAERILEAEADRVLSQQSGIEKISEQEVEDIASKLEGLGYLK